MVNNAVGEMITLKQYLEPYGHKFVSFSTVPVNFGLQQENDTRLRMINTCFHSGNWINIISNSMEHSISRRLLGMTSSGQSCLLGITSSQSNFVDNMSNCALKGSSFYIYRQTSSMSCTLVGNKLVDHSDVVGASLVCATPTTSSFST